uniref:uncharacterized protein LOC122595723 n=1 Tax=Erigeron canadensis TaxID=72917 RepID=UPI001CB93C35|nr:uncharacterized protein LOC122595723 [Erigeron canadensis]
MPLLDIATSQYMFRTNKNNNKLNSFKKDHHVSFLSGDSKTKTTTINRWIYLHNNNIPTSSSFHMNLGCRLMIKAVATLEPICSNSNSNTSAQLQEQQQDNVNVNNNNNSVGSLLPAAAPADEKPVQDEKELLRRNRISKANKGRGAWNKGIKHSPETRQKIRERTKLAMSNPQVKMKLMKGIHNQTRETRAKIAAAVRETWDRRRFTRRMIARCHREWLDLIAEASRKGLSGEEELQWDSYEILSKQHGKEFREGIESRKKRPNPGVRAPKSLEQRKKISEAIAAKWADPAYRDRVYSGIAKHRGKDPDTRDPEWGTKKKVPKKVKPVKNREGTIDTRIRSYRPKVKTSSGPVHKEPQPRFKDPQARYKLEMIKSIRAQRAASDPKISEAILRANILIGEAQRAAEALEAAAAKSPMAEASLVETRKLIAEAISYIKSIETGNSGCIQDSLEKEEIVEDVKELEEKEVNGVATLGLKDAEIAKFSELGLETNGIQHAGLSTSLSSTTTTSSVSSSSWSDLRLQTKEVKTDIDKHDRGGKGRRWVCGRLVEDEDEEDQ